MAESALIWMGFIIALVALAIQVASAPMSDSTVLRLILGGIVVVVVIVFSMVL